MATDGCYSTVVIVLGVAAADNDVFIQLLSVCIPWLVPAGVVVFVLVVFVLVIFVLVVLVVLVGTVHSAGISTLSVGCRGAR